MPLPETLHDPPGMPRYFIVAGDDHGLGGGGADAGGGPAARRTVDALGNALIGGGVAAFLYRGDARTWTFWGDDRWWGEAGTTSPIDEGRVPIRPEDRPLLGRALRAAALGRRMDVVVRIDDPDGSTRTARLVGQRVGTDAGLVAGVACEATGAAEPGSSLKFEARNPAAMELAHRLGNVFPLILMMISMSVRNHPGCEDLAAALGHRIRALAQAHHLLARRANWTSTIEEIVRSTVSPYDLRNRIAIAGEEFFLTNGMAEGFGLVVNELATNSMKHGALGERGGRVDARWRTGADVPPGHVVFEWIETEAAAFDVGRAGAPGFGTMILGLVGRPIVGSEARFALTDNGMRYTLTMRVEPHPPGPKRRDAEVANEARDETAGGGSI